MKTVAFAALTLFLLGGAVGAVAMSPIETQDRAQRGSAQSTPLVSQKIRDQLAKEGLTDIKVAPGEYVVHAKNKEGDPVMMVVSPNSFLAVTDVKMANSNDAQGKPSLVEPDPTPLADQH